MLGASQGDFRRFVPDIAAAEGLDPAGLILGDDNPGPDPWQELPAVAKRHSTEEPPVYVIGTEVPVPGGALETVEHLVVTTPAHPGLARSRTIRTGGPPWQSITVQQVSEFLRLNPAANLGPRREQAHGHQHLDCLADC